MNRVLVDSNGFLGVHKIALRSVPPAPARYIDSMAKQGSAADAHFRVWRDGMS